MAIDQILRDQLENLLASNPDKDDLISQLDTADEEGIVEVWGLIVPVLLSTYYAARDDIKGFERLANAISDLEPVTDLCIATLTGKFKDHNKLANDLVQLQFRVSQYYSLSNQFEKCMVRHAKTEQYLADEGLEETLNGAIWNNLCGGDLARQYTAGNLAEFPHSSVEHFQKALAIHNKIGSTLEKTKEMRHIQMCLTNVMLQEAMFLVLKHQEYTTEMYEEVETAEGLISSLEPHVFGDLYRMAGLCQSRSYVSILYGNFAEALSQIEQAADLMPKEQYGQSAHIHNDNGDVHLMIAALRYMQAIELTTNRSETMYGVKSAASLKLLEEIPYVKLMKIIKQQYAISDRSARLEESSNIVNLLYNFSNIARVSPINSLASDVMPNAQEQNTEECEDDFVYEEPYKYEDEESDVDHKSRSPASPMFKSN